MTTIPRFFPRKHPQAIETRAIDWAAELPTGVTITGSTWTVAPSGLTLTAPAVNGAITSITTSEGVSGAVHEITNVVQLSNGHRLAKTVPMLVMG